MNIKDQVRVYLEGGWYNEGVIRAFSEDNQYVEVDFMDWIQRYPIKDLRLNYIYYEPIWIPISAGITIVDYR